MIPFESSTASISPDGEAAVVVVFPAADPTLVGLALDIGLGRFPLRVQRTEFLVEAFFGRLASVDSAANGLIL